MPKVILILFIIFICISDFALTILGAQIGSSAFSRVINQFNTQIFGYLGYVYPLIFLSLIFYIKFFSARFFIGIILLFTSALFLQFLLFDSGIFGAVLLEQILSIFGYFISFLFSIFLAFLGWIFISKESFLKSLKHFKVLSFVALKEGYKISLNVCKNLGEWVVLASFSAYKNGKKMWLKILNKKTSNDLSVLDEIFDKKAQNNINQSPLIGSEPKNEQNEQKESEDPLKNAPAIEELYIKKLPPIIRKQEKPHFEIKLKRDANLPPNHDVIKDRLISSIQNSSLKLKEQDFAETIEAKEAKVQIKESVLKNEPKNIKVTEIAEVAEKRITPKEPQKIAKTEISKSNSTFIKELLKNELDLQKGELAKPINYALPSIDMLANPPVVTNDAQSEELDSKIKNLLSKLKIFKIDGDILDTHCGPLVSIFEFRPANHIKVSRISSLSDDLAMELSTKSIRIQAPIPGKNVVGIEIANKDVETIYLRQILESKQFKESASPLSLALGKNIVGEPYVTDLQKLPHLLIAGTTGSGKSVGINSMIISMLFRNSPDSLRLVLIDPKMVEFSMYEDIPHLLTPIITNPKNAISALKSSTIEMERRYKLMREMKTKTIEGYNQKVSSEDKFPFLVIIIDELADLMMTAGKEVEHPIGRIAQMGRACGVHLIVATQRPSADILSGLIKGSLPTRIAFRVSNKIDSRVILDVEGAQSLLGRGDMLFTPPGSNIMRLHAPWISEEEILAIVNHIKNERQVVYDEGFIIEERELISPITSDLDDLNDLDKAKEIILSTQKTSISFLQRRMGIGYNKAASLIEELEKSGFLSEPNAKGIRDIL
ncbi:MAG: DNA translocase FtsK [Helicobacter sp.]|nr:DNA translocase FtsK [Helicobacter sp.]